MLRVAWIDIDACVVEISHSRLCGEVAFIQYPLIVVEHLHHTWTSAIDQTTESTSDGVESAVDDADEVEVVVVRSSRLEGIDQCELVGIDGLGVFLVSTGLCPALLVDEVRVEEGRILSFALRHGVDASVLDVAPVDLESQSICLCYLSIAEIYLHDAESRGDVCINTIDADVVDGLVVGEVL